MGQAPSIADLAKQHKEDADYLDQITKRLKETVGQEVTDFHAGTQKFYADQNLDFSIISTGYQMDFKQESDFSLGKITDMINGIAGVLFGHDPNKKMPPGGPSQPSVDSLNAIAPLAGFETLAIQAGISIINSVLALFSTSTSQTYNKSEIRKELAPGLMIHMYSTNQIFKSETAFTNQSIFTTGFSFDIVFSKAQRVLLDDIAFLSSMEAGIKELLDTWRLANTQYAKLSIDFDVSQEKKDAARKAVNDLLLQINEVRKQIHESSTKTINQFLL